MVTLAIEFINEWPDGAATLDPLRGGVAGMLFCSKEGLPILEESRDRTLTPTSLATPATKATCF